MNIDLFKKDQPTKKPGPRHYLIICSRSWVFGSREAADKTRANIYAAWKIRGHQVIFGPTRTAINDRKAVIDAANEMSIQAAASD